MGLSGMFFQPIQHLRSGFLRGTVLRVTQVMFRCFPHVSLPGHQGAKARVTQQDAGLFCQVQPQAVERPDREGQPNRVRVEFKHPRQFVTVGGIGFLRASAAQPRHPILTPAFVPSIDRVARHHDGLRHLFGGCPKCSRRMALARWRTSGSGAWLIASSSTPSSSFVSLYCRRLPMPTIVSQLADFRPSA